MRHKANERSRTRVELIEPQLRASGWGEDGSRILLEQNAQIIAGRLSAGRSARLTSRSSTGLSTGSRPNALKADYVLEHNNRRLASKEAKSYETEIGEGVMQAKLYSQKLELKYAYAANGREIYEI